MGTEKSVGAVLILGGGIAGIQSALDLHSVRRSAISPHTHTIPSSHHCESHSGRYAFPIGGIQ